jgi:hypothetical protein
LTWSVQDPSAPTYPDARQRVREAVGDIDKTINDKLLVPNELIDYFVETFGEARAKVETIKDILARYAREADTGTRSADLAATRRFERLKQLYQIMLADLGKTLPPGSTVNGAFIRAPYLSNATRAANQADGDLNQGAAIRVGMFDSDNGS